VFIPQGGHLQIGAPTGKWLLVVIYRGKHDPVSKNYLASLQQIIYELDELGVEVVAVSGDGRERAESFVRAYSYFGFVGPCTDGRQWFHLWIYLCSI
jgi:peroxiredoxin